MLPPLVVQLKERKTMAYCMPSLNDVDKRGGFLGSVTSKKGTEFCHTARMFLSTTQINTIVTKNDILMA